MLSSTLRRCMIGLASVSILAGAAVLWAGPLNPPTGPVSAGGKTTQEIYDAVTGLTGSIGGSGRGPAVPGSNAGAGTLSLPASGPFGAINVPLIGMRFSVTGTGFNSSGQLMGTTTLTSCTMIREIGAGGASQWRLVTGTPILTSATVSIPSSGGGVTTYQFGNTVIAAVRAYSVQRSDGTYASIEEIDLSTTSARVTEPGGATWNYNFVTRVGGG